jgi:hypothetical protein
MERQAKRFLARGWALRTLRAEDEPKTSKEIEWIPIDGDKRK